ncbi:unnamed protein product [Agarophyton chilense]
MAAGTPFGASRRSRITSTIVSSHQVPGQRRSPSSKSRSRVSWAFFFVPTSCIVLLGLLFWKPARHATPPSFQASLSRLPTAQLERFFSAAVPAVSNPSAAFADRPPRVSGGEHDGHAFFMTDDVSDPFFGKCYVASQRSMFHPSLSRGPDRAEIKARRVAKQPRDFDDVFAVVDEKRFLHHADRPSVHTVDELGAGLDTDYDDVRKVAMSLTQQDVKKGTVNNIHTPVVYVRNNRRDGFQSIVNVRGTVEYFNRNGTKRAAKPKVSRVVTVTKGFGRPCQVHFVRPRESVRIHVVVTYAGRPSRLAAFLTMFNSYFKKTQTDLLRVVLATTDKEKSGVKSKVKKYKHLTSNRITVVSSRGDVNGDFSRAVAIREAAKLVPDKEIMFFSDIDLVIRGNFLQNCRVNSIMGSQVWFPVMFSLYPHGKSLSSKDGFWRRSSYGMVCVYKSDFDKVGGFGGNEEKVFQGWGSEDVFLYNQFRDNPDYAVLRTLEPGHRPLKSSSSLPTTEALRILSYQPNETRSDQLSNFKTRALFGNLASLVLDTIVSSGPLQQLDRMTPPLTFVSALPLCSRGRRSSFVRGRDGLSTARRHNVRANLFVRRSARVRMATSTVESLRLNPIKQMSGTINLPGSKSLSNRVLLLSALASGTTEIRNLLQSDDVRYMKGALDALGIHHEQVGDVVRVTGCAGHIPIAKADLFLGNAGTAMRPLAAALCTGSQPGVYVLDGTPRMRERPIADLVDALKQLGADVECSDTGCPPVVIRNKDGLPGGEAYVSGKISSQYLSALLMTAPLAKKDVTIMIKDTLVSVPYVKMTINLMARYGVTVNVNKEYTQFKVAAQQQYVSPGEVFVEGDASSASYFLAGAAITGGPVTVHGCGSDSIQGDVQFASVLEQMGAQVEWDNNSIRISRDARHGLKGVDVDCGDIPDAAMSLATTALFAEGKTAIRNVYNWRVKETERMKAIVTELRKLGAEVEEGHDYCVITPPKTLREGVAIDTYDDHRMAMAFSLAACGDVAVVINDPACTAKTFPTYFEELAKLTCA